MKRKFLAGVLGLLVLTSFVLDTEGQKPEQYLNRFFKLLKKNSIYRTAVNLDSLQNLALSEIAGARTIKDCYPVMLETFNRMGDRHSMLLTPDMLEHQKRIASSYQQQQIKNIVVQELEGGIGYLSMPSFNAQDQKQLVAYADTMHQRIKSLESRSLKGWIVDLRENSGGNCWPMLAGIGPLLGEGVCGYFQNSYGTYYAWVYQAGSSFQGRRKIVSTSTTPYPPLSTTVPIAVLIGNNTASSGEIVAIAFKGRPHTRFFGEPTYGLTTGNSMLPLSDGAILNLATSVFADRNKTRYFSRLVPDEIVPYQEQEIRSSKDNVLNRANAWLYNVQQ